MVRVHRNKSLQHLIQLLAVMSRDLGIETLKDFSKESIHILSAEGRL